MYDYTKSSIYQNWLNILFSNVVGMLKYPDKKLAEIIKKTKINSFYTIEEVAELVEISLVTLRAYESVK